MKSYLQFILIVLSIFLLFQAADFGDSKEQDFAHEEQDYMEQSIKNMSLSLDLGKQRYLSINADRGEISPEGILLVEAYECRLLSKGKMVFGVSGSGAKINLKDRRVYSLGKNFIHSSADKKVQVQNFDFSIKDDRLTLRINVTKGRYFALSGENPRAEVLPQGDAFMQLSAVKGELYDGVRVGQWSGDLVKILYKDQVALVSKKLRLSHERGSCELSKSQDLW